MLYGHCYGAIAECGQEGDGPAGAVAPAEGYLVALTDAAFVEEDMELLDFPRYVVILQRGSFVVGQGVVVPMFDDALLDV